MFENLYIEFAAKAIGLAGSVVAAYKLFFEIVLQRKTRLRDEYKFVREFLVDIKTSSEAHPYLIEKGFTAILGIDNLTAKEIQYLLSQPNPSLSLKRYSAARKRYVKYSEHEHRIRFIDQFTDPAKRKRSKILSGLGYFTFAPLSLAPLFFAEDLFKNNWQMAVIFIIMWLFAFGPLAILCLLEVGRITKGEELVNGQHPLCPPLSADAPSVDGTPVI